MLIDQLIGLLNREIEPGSIKEWYPLIHIAQQHNVHAWLYRIIKDKEGIDPDCFNLLKKYAERTIGSSITHLSLARNLNKTLSSVGINPIFLKGMDLILRGYIPFSERPLADIDVLILEKNWQNAIDILLSNGYTYDEKYLNEYPKGFIERYGSNMPLYYDKLQVELIRSPLTMMAYRRLTGWDYDAWEGDLIKVNVQGMEYTLPGRVQSLIYIIIHSLIDHNQLRLIWLRDMYSCIHEPDFPWDSLIKTCYEYHLRKPVFLALSFLNLIFKAHIDDKILKAFKIKMEIQEIEGLKTSLLNNVLHGESEIRHKSFAFMLDSRLDFIRFSLYHLFPSIDYLKARYDLPYYKLPLAYLKRILSPFGFFHKTGEIRHIIKEEKVLAVFRDDIIPKS